MSKNVSNKPERILRDVGLFVIIYVSLLYHRYLWEVDVVQSAYYLYLTETEWGVTYLNVAAWGKRRKASSDVAVTRSLFWTVYASNAENNYHWDNLHDMFL
jgi:hypothetical protein